MTDNSKNIAEKIVAAIDAGYASRHRESKARDYIGASGIGSDCHAELQFSLRGFPNDEPAPKTQRIFNLGHAIEDIVVRDLKERADVRVWETDPLTGKQHAYSEWGGHVAAHADGHVQLDDGSDEVAILEVKSMAASRWRAFVKHGLKSSNPNYFAQAQMLMGMSGVRKTLLVAYNKDTSDYHAEIVEFDELEWASLEAKITRVLEGARDRIASKRDDWRCRTCFKRTVCWEGKAPEGKTIQTACQTCAHAAPQKSGEWLCTKHGHITSEACPDYEQLLASEKGPDVRP